MLSRVIWPPFPAREALSKIKQAFEDGLIQRVCIQALNYPTVFNDLMSLAKAIRDSSSAPISVSCQPLDQEKVIELARVGVNRVSIALDTATERLFNEIKGKMVDGPYSWERHIQTLKAAVQLFGRNSVTTHLIVGLGETDGEIIRTIQWCVDTGVYPALFAFTPIPGTRMMNHPPPPLSYYRRVQVAHYLITHNMIRQEKMKFKDGRLMSFGVSESQLRETIRTGEPFRTTGCPGCNRPYYNERPGGPIYNYPRKLEPEEIAEIERQILSSS